MAFTVEFTKRSEAQLSTAFNFVADQSSPAIAAKWLARLKKAIFGLENFPLRYAVAREAKKLGFPYRRMLFGRKRGAFLIYYKVTSSGEDEGKVTITHIRRALRDKPNAADFLE